MKKLFALITFCLAASTLLAHENSSFSHNKSHCGDKSLELEVRHSACHRAEEVARDTGETLNWRLFIQLARVHFQLEHFETAAYYYEKSSATIGKNTVGWPEFVSYICWSYNHHGDRERAIKWADVLIKSGREGEWVNYGFRCKVNALQEMHKYAKAEHLLKRKLKAADAKAEWYRDLGGHYLKWAEASVRFRLKKDNKMKPLRALEAATDNLNKAISLNASDPASWFFRGLAYEALDLPDLALQDYREALSRNPTDRASIEESIERLVGSSPTTESVDLSDGNDVVAVYCKRYASGALSYKKNSYDAVAAAVHSCTLDAREQASYEAERLGLDKPNDVVGCCRLVAVSGSQKCLSVFQDTSRREVFLGRSTSSLSAAVEEAERSCGAGNPDCTRIGSYCAQ